MAGWSERIPAAAVAPSCASMIGHTYRTRPVREPRRPVGAVEIDPDDPAIPAPIRALHPVAIDVGPTDVDLVLGRYVPAGAAEDEIDRYGLVCAPNGKLSAAFTSLDGPFLKPLGPGLWSYDRVL
ncbi:hypothetical protein BH11MYX1_BH11MYX1_04500 [soil metagenome]